MSFEIIGEKGILLADP